MYFSKKGVQLHSQEYRECTRMFNIGKKMKIDIVVAVTTQII